MWKKSAFDALEGNLQAQALAIRYRWVVVYDGILEYRIETRGCEARRKLQSEVAYVGKDNCTTTQKSV